MIPVCFHISWGGSHNRGAITSYAPNTRSQGQNSTTQLDNLDPKLDNQEGGLRRGGQGEVHRLLALQLGIEADV